MSHEKVIAGLKRLIKQELTDIGQLAQIIHLATESDRSALILNGAFVETHLLWALQKRMPTLNQDERDRIFNFEGPCGSFSNRIRMAQGLGIIDRPTRRHLEVIKELRNVAAHCHRPVRFNTTEIRTAIAEIFGSAGTEIIKWERPFVRNLYAKLCERYAAAFGMDGEKVDLGAIFLTEAARRMRVTSSPEISSEA